MGSIIFSTIKESDHGTPGEKRHLPQARQKDRGLETRAPWNDKLYAILKELYTAEETDVVVKMPYGLSTVDRTPH